MAVLYKNFLGGTTTDNPLTSGALAINSAGLASLPTVTAPDIMYLVLDPDATAGAPEIITVTAHSASSTTATILRGQQTTVARSHAAGTTWRHTATATDLTGKLTSVSTGDIVNGAVTPQKLALLRLDVSCFGPQNMGAGAVTAVAYDAENSDPDGWITVPNNTITAPVGSTGFYLIVNELTWVNQVGAASPATPQVFTNGVQRAAATPVAPVLGAYTTSSSVVRLNDGDTIQVKVSVGASGNINIQMRTMFLRLG